MCCSESLLGTSSEMLHGLDTNLYHPLWGEVQNRINKKYIWMWLYAIYVVLYLALHISSVCMLATSVTLVFIFCFCNAVPR